MPHLLSPLLVAASLSLCGCMHQTSIADQDATALVAAIRAANQRPGPDLIRLAKGGLYAMRDQPETGLLLPAITGELVIEGDGAEIRRDSNVHAALLLVTSEGKLTLKNLSLAEGSDGAVRNYGTLRLESVKITDCSSWNALAIVLNHGRLQALDSEIAYNNLPMNHRDGGIVLNYGELILGNTRIHDNLVQARYPSVAVAGAILNLGSVRVTGSGIEHNRTEDDPAGLEFAGIIDMGNGHVEGPMPVSSIREAGYADLPAARL